MTDLETRLRAELAEQAEQVPPSEQPWRGHRRRLARRRTRLVAGAAVVVGLAVAVPVVLHPAAPDPTAALTVRPAPAVPADPARVLAAGPFVLAGTGAGELRVLLLRTGDLCVVGGGTTDCAALAGPADAGPVRTRSVRGLAHALLFVGEPGVHGLTVRDGAGRSVPLRHVGTANGFELWLARFPGPVDGFGYHGVDGAGQVFEVLT